MMLLTKQNRRDLPAIYSQESKGGETDKALNRALSQISLGREFVIPELICDPDC